MNETTDYSAKYLVALQKGRNNLLMVAGLTVLNIILYYAQSTITFPFSAFLPQAAVAIGLEGEYVTGSPIFLVLGIFLAVLVIGFYVASALLSKKRPGWFIAALIMFLIDTGILLWFCFPGFEVESLIDIAFHCWVLYYLVRAVIARSKLKLIAEQPAQVESAEGVAQGEVQA